MSDLITGLIKKDLLGKNETNKLRYKLNDFFENEKIMIIPEKFKNAVRIGEIVVSEMNLGVDPFYSAVLYYSLNYESKILEKLEKYFTPDIRFMIEDLNKITNLSKARYKGQVENFIKLILTISDDIRIVFINLAEQLNNLRNISLLSDEEKTELVSRVKNIYIAIAHRLGLYKIKTEMDDLVLKNSQNDIYKSIAGKLHDKKKEREKYVNDFIWPIKKRLKETGYKFEITGRPKSIASIWSKMQRQGVPFEKVYDLFAIRIIIDCSEEIKNYLEEKKLSGETKFDERFPEKACCWEVYSIVTEQYKPNTERLRNWIDVPKSNGYESLHTTVVGSEGKWIEVQIRTKRMDEIAEGGLAAHWKYKEYAGKDKNEELLYNALKKALSNPVEGSRSSDTKASLYSDEIFIFTPKGEIKKLKKGDTVLDFAFIIHTKIGMRCKGAIVNGSFKSFRHKLNNGDVVKIIISGNQRPRNEWLSIVNNQRVKTKIRRLLKDIEFKWANLGKELLQKKFKNINIEFNDLNLRKLEKHFGCDTTIELFAGFGEEKFDLQKIKDIITSDDNQEIIKEKILSLEDLDIKIPGDKFLFIDNEIDSLDYSFSKCCHPIPGDEIFAFISVSRGAKIHRLDCKNAADIIKKYPYRIFKAKWKESQSDFSSPITIMITGKDHLGMVNSITDVVSNTFKLKMSSANITSSKQNNTFKAFIIVEVSGKKQLDALINRLLKIKDVVNVARIK